MRLLFLILLLLNAVAYGYIRFAEGRAGSDNQLPLLMSLTITVGLPATGAEDSAPLVAGAAALLLLGTGVLVGGAVRRRRIA